MASGNRESCDPIIQREASAQEFMGTHSPRTSSLPLAQFKVVCKVGAATCLEQA